MLNSEQWQKIKELFEQAIELTIDKRKEFLDSNSPDKEMRKEVEALIESFQQIENLSFLRKGVINSLIEKSISTSTIIENNSISLHTDSEQLETEEIKQNTKPLNMLIGQIISDRYYIEKVIGQGSTGIIYLAKDTKINKPRAIKLLLPQAQKHSNIEIRLIKEANTSQKIKHPNLVTSYDLDKTSDNRLFLVMEYINGMDLRKQLATYKAVYSPEEALSLLKPILEVVEELHSQGIIHRDIKPENILIGKNEEGNEVIKLTDLGIAKYYNALNQDGSEQPLTAKFALIGTPSYMSPEQWQEKPKDAIDNSWEIDKRTDIYSIGIILYEIISGKKPFNNKNLFNLSEQHISEIATPLDELNSKMPKEYSKVVAKAMEKDRTDRFSSVKELLEALEQACSKGNSDKLGGQ